MERSGLLVMWCFVSTARYYIDMHYCRAKFFKCNIMPAPSFPILTAQLIILPVFTALMNCRG